MFSFRKVKLKEIGHLQIFEGLSRGRVAALALYNFKIAKWDQLVNLSYVEIFWSNIKNTFLIELSKDRIDFLGWE